MKLTVGLSLKQSKPYDPQAAWMPTFGYRNHDDDWLTSDEVAVRAVEVAALLHMPFERDLDFAPRRAVPA